MQNKKQNKNSTWIWILIGAFFFMGKKAKATPSVEVGDGYFGEFDSDGEFDVEPKVPVIATPPYAGKTALVSAKMPIMNVENHSYAEITGQCQ